MKSNAEWIRPIAIGGVVGVFAALGFVFGILDMWSARATDRLFLPHSIDHRIVIVAIDDASLGQIGRWPWPRAIHAELIRKLTEAGASAIGYDVNFPEPSDAINDGALAKALAESGRVVLPIELRLLVKQGNVTFDPRAIIAPMAAMSSAARATGHSNTPPDVDGTVRRIPLVIHGPDRSTIPSFVSETLRVANVAPAPDAPVDRAGRLLINFANAPFRSFRTIAAVDILRGRAKLDFLKNAIVFVGSTAADLHDALLVPTSQGIPMPGVEIHASAADTILNHRWLRPVPAGAIAIELIAIGLLIGYLFSRLRVRWSFPLLCLLWILLIVSALLLFDRGWITEIVWPTLTLVFASVAVTLERRLTADQQRRQLKQALSQYISPSVVQSILRDPSSLQLGGERRRMSVLFSDIRGFTTISEGLTPERLVQILNIYLDRMTTIVFSHNGVLDKYIGDAVMAFWNAPFDQPDHAKMAALTALDMHTALATLNREKVFGDLELKIGIGVNTGDVVVGNVGGESRFDYTVIGDNVNLASRIEGLTKEYRVPILVTEATTNGFGGEILTRKLDKVAVKGKKEPVVIYEAMERMGSATEEHKNFARDFEAALKSYFAQNFLDALARCTPLLAAHPLDAPTQLLHERAKQFIETPPPADWDGTWVYTKK